MKDMDAGLSRQPYPFGRCLTTGDEKKPDGTVWSIRAGIEFSEKFDEGKKEDIHDIIHLASF